MSNKKEQLREGYKNTQELIRFMDAKAGVAVGFSGMIFVHCMDKFFSDFPCMPSASVFSIYVIKILLLIAFILSTLVAFFKSFSCIQARGPMKDTKHPKILFPYGNSTDFGVFREEVENISEEHEYEELTAQVFNTGHILERKMAECKTGIKALIWQVVIWGIIMFVFLLDKNI